jgi:hypothetical protein
MELDPAEVGRIAGAWDEQHLELAATGQQIGGASGRGFSESVAGAATRFAAGWGRAATALGEVCESRADSMRTSVQLALAADGTARADLVAVMDSIAERR